MVFHSRQTSPHPESNVGLILVTFKQIKWLNIRVMNPVGTHLHLQLTIQCKKEGAFYGNGQFSGKAPPS